MKVLGKAFGTFVNEKVLCLHIATTVEGIMRLLGTRKCFGMQNAAMLGDVMRPFRIASGIVGRRIGAG